MSQNYSLIHEPWIPIRSSAGSLVHLGIREALVQAHLLQFVEDSNPLVVASVFRILLAILHRAVEGPTDLEHRMEIFDAGAFDTKLIDDYLQRHENRFHLLGIDPFFQVGDLALDKSTALGKLAVERSSGNNKALFDHTLDGKPKKYGLAEAARVLIAHQAFSLCGGVSGGGFKNFTDAASPRGAIIIPQGHNFFETLVASLLPYQEDSVRKQDLPIWEREPLTQSRLKESQQGPMIAGPAGLYSWPSRAIRLLRSDADTIQQCYYASGLIPVAAPTDPAVSYRHNKEGLRSPVKVDANKAIWRDLCSLVPPNSTDGAGIVSALDRLGRKLRVGRIQPLLILGQSAKPGKPVVESWTSTSLPLPESWLESESSMLGTNTQKALDYSEEVVRALKDAVRTAAAEFSDKEKAGSIVDSVSIDQEYWAQLQSVFYQALPRFSAPESLEQWKMDCKKIAFQAYDRLEPLLGANCDGFALQAWTIGQTTLSWLIYKIDAPKDHQTRQGGKKPR